MMVILGWAMAAFKLACENVGEVVNIISQSSSMASSMVSSIL